MVDGNPILAFDQAQTAAKLERSVHQRTRSSSQSSFHNIGCYARCHSWIRETCPAFENDAARNDYRRPKGELDAINVTFRDYHSTGREWWIWAAGLSGPQNIVTWWHPFKLKRAAGVNRC